MKSLLTYPIHLGLGAKVVQQPAFTGMDWYSDYAKRNAADGVEGRLVTMHAFSKSWEAWEMHPHGSELILCVDGSLTLIQEIDGRQVKSRLGWGETAINPPGVWHTADVDDSATCVFITAGADTQHRPRAV